MDSSSLKYNYVILSTDWDVYRQLYCDVIGRDDVCYVAGPQASKRGLRKILYRLHFNKQLNHIVSLPFKGVWNHSYFTCPFQDKKPICFVLFRDWVSLDKYTGYINWLKFKYPGAKFVWFLHDMLANHNDFYTGDVLDVYYYKRELDLVVTCNPMEALKYELYFHKVPVSKLCKDKPACQCDVLFIGQDKGRLNQLIHIYDVLTQKGARCYFFVLQASQQVIDPVREGIILLDRPMPYEKCQEWAAKSNCLLELRCDSRAGETLRASETLIYGKKLLTDFSVLVDSDDFDMNNLRILDTDDGAGKIDLSFLTTPLEISPEKMEAYRKRLSPLAFLEELDTIL